MVLYYSHTNKNKIANYIATQLADELILINENNASQTEEFHSEKPFTVIVDCSECTMFELHNKLQMTSFTGSKILYCIFISPPTNQLVKEASKIFAGAKDLVLFGYDVLSADANGKLKSAETERLKLQLNQIQNCCPFDSKDKLAFPYCGRTA